MTPSAKTEMVLTRTTVLLFLTALFIMIARLVPNNGHDFGTVFILLAIAIALHLCRNLHRATHASELQNAAFDALLHRMPNGVVTYSLDDKLTIRYANDSFFDLIGYTPEEVQSQFNGSGWPFAGSEQLSHKIPEIGIDFLPENFTLDFPLLRKDGTSIWITASCYRQQNQQGQNTLTYLMVNNTSQKQHEDELRYEKECFDIAVALTDDIVFKYDIKKDIMICSDKYIEFFAQPATIENYSQGIDQRTYIHPASRETLRNFRRDCLASKANVTAEIQLFTLRNAYEWFRINGKIICDADGQPRRIIGKVTNIDSQKNVIAQLQNKAYHDPLTGLYNKAATEALINESLLSLEPFADQQAALLIIDIDDFKKINDSLGHLAGDAVLEAIAGKMQSVFSDQTIIGRIGGDEFVIFIPQLAASHEILPKADALAASLQQIKPGSHPDARITASIGIAFAPHHGTTYKSLLAGADKALYTSKNSGKNNFAIAAQA